MAAQANAQTGIYPVGNGGNMPCEGAKAVTAQLNFVTNAAYLVDLTSLFNNSQFSALQTLYIDNTQNTSPITAVVAGSNQSLTIPAGRGGYFPVIAVNPPKVLFSSAGAFTVFVALLNFYLPGQIWGN